MTMRANLYRLIIGIVVALSFASDAIGNQDSTTEPSLKDGAFHVHPNQSIQAALDLAAADPIHKKVIVHAGVYRPAIKSQALIYFNEQHDGITLESDGDVILTAANPEIADRTSASFPAIVNHVVYFGDGISRNTTLKNFKITGANNFVTDHDGEKGIEPHFQELKKTEGFYGCLFFYTDGGGIKIFGRSYPTIDQVEVYDCFSNPCGGAISIEHRGYIQDSVLITNSIFRNNRSLVTGSAVDLLPKSSAVLENCLFVGNISNTGLEYTHVKGNIDWPEIPNLISTTLTYQAKHGSGALTVFPGSRIAAKRCTFTGNFNGADDRAAISIYANCIFWDNTAAGGKRSGDRYELDAANGKYVKGCFIGGKISDLRGSIQADQNRLDCQAPDFDNQFIPKNPLFNNVGYRPIKK